MRRTLLLTLLTLLAVPAGAHAAKAKISPDAPAVSPSGVVTFEAANPNRYALRGTATVVVGGKTVARRSVRLGRRAVSELHVKLTGRALEAVRAAGGRATIALKLRRSGGRATTTARRTLTLTLPAPASGPAAPAPAPAPTEFNARMGTEGAYDDFTIHVEHGQATFTKPPTVPVYCYENGGSYRSALSFEIFDAPGPWTIGQPESELKKEGLSVNQLVGSSPRGITFKVKNLAQDPTHVVGELSMSFFESKYNVFTNEITFINCSGSQAFEALPA